MLDDLRSSATFSEEEEALEPDAMPARARGTHNGLILGMNASQRFIVVLMLFMLVCVFGFLALMAFNKIALPFF